MPLLMMNNLWSQISRETSTGRTTPHAPLETWTAPAARSTRAFHPPLRQKQRHLGSPCASSPWTGGMLSQKRICGADSCRGAWLRLWRPVGDVSHVFSRVVASRRFRRVGGVSRAGVRWLRQWCGGSAGPSARRRRLLISSARCSESSFVAGLGWQRCVVRVYFVFF